MAQARASIIQQAREEVHAAFAVWRQLSLWSRGMKNCEELERKQQQDDKDATKMCRG